jgi:hypothetical protein
MLELFGRRRTVERKIETDCPKQRFPFVLIARVFGQTVLLEPAFRIRLFVDLAPPAFIGPSRGAEPYQRRKRHVDSYSLFLFVREVPDWDRQSVRLLPYQGTAK